MTRRYRFCLELDPSTAGRFYCGGDEGLYAVLARTLIPHDPGRKRTQAVFSRFRDLLRDEFTGGSERSEREQIVRACESLVAPGELMHERPDDLLTFTILRPYGDECRVYSLAAERVLLIRDGEWQEPIIPASAAAALEERGIDRKSALSAAGIIQEAVRVGSDVARHMRSVTVPCSGGDWVLVTPESKALVGLQLPRQPVTREDMVDVMKTIGAPYGAFTRSWLALQVQDS